MKVLAFVVLAFASFGVLESAPLDDKNLADILQGLIDQVLSGIPNALVVKDIKLNIPKNDIENGVITINEVSLTGLKKLVSKLKYDEKSHRLNYTLNYPDLAAVVDFTVKLEGLVNVEHHLSAHVDLNDLKNEGFAVIAEDKDEIKDFSLLLTLGKSKVDIKGLLNNDELSEKVSKFLTEHVSVILDTIDPILAPYFSFIIKDLINIALKIVKN